MPAWRAYTGQTESEVRGWGWLGAPHPEVRDRIVEAQGGRIRIESQAGQGETFRFT